ncbi:MAG: twin-arginine translocase TatA/TatE family subunit [Candidatus Freyarchaeota archaeon]
MISGWEWVVILAIIAVLILWGPKKLPEIARAIGEAKREFQRASKELQEIPREVVNPEPSYVTVTRPSSDDVLITTAKKLGISTEGKTKEQISQEIVEKVKATS